MNMSSLKIAWMQTSLPVAAPLVLCAAPGAWAQ
jgi:hypothetical protein